MVGLANLYSSGDGVEQDTHKALELRKKAAALGNKQAMRDIAFMYEYGLGVEKIQRLQNIGVRKERFNRFIFYIEFYFI